jgi:hypothetical protein
LLVQLRERATAQKQRIGSIGCLWRGCLLLVFARRKSPARPEEEAAEALGELWQQQEWEEEKEHSERT